MAKTVRLVGPRQREHAHHLIDQAPQGYVMKLAEETRNDRQNAALWGWIKVLRQELPEQMGRFSPEDCKLRFMNALGVEMRFLPELEGAGMFPVGHRSSTLTKDQFAALLTLIDEYAARNGVELPRHEF